VVLMILGAAAVIAVGAVVAIPVWAAVAASTINVRSVIGAAGIQRPKGGSRYSA
jgi:hypothetical protein